MPIWLSGSCTLGSHWARVVLTLTVFVFLWWIALVATNVCVMCRCVNACHALWLMVIKVPYLKFTTHRGHYGTYKLKKKPIILSSLIFALDEKNQIFLHYMVVYFFYEIGFSWKLLVQTVLSLASIQNSLIVPNMLHFAFFSLYNGPNLMCWKFCLVDKFCVSFSNEILSNGWIYRVEKWKIIVIRCTVQCTQNGTCVTCIYKYNSSSTMDWFVSTWLFHLSKHC